jgi:hypothetical protein
MLRSKTLWLELESDFGSPLSHAPSSGGGVLGSYPADLRRVKDLLAALRIC